MCVCACVFVCSYPYVPVSVCVCVCVCVRQHPSGSGGDGDDVLLDAFEGEETEAVTDGEMLVGSRASTNTAAEAETR